MCTHRYIYGGAFLIIGVRKNTEWKHTYFFDFYHLRTKSTGTTTINVNDLYNVTLLARVDDSECEEHQK